MHFELAAIFLLFGAALCHGATTTANKTVFDDRINLNFNVGHAQAYGPDGSFSNANSASYGYQAGILYPGNRYQHLGSHTASKSNAYSSGPRAPQAFSNTGVALGPYGAKGNVAAGYYGGKGNAFTQSQSQQFAIPVGFGGAVLLSNIPENLTNATTSKEKPTGTATNATKPSEKDEDKNKNKLQFS